MNPAHRLYTTYTVPTEEEAKQLAYSGEDWYTVEVRPPRSQKLSSTLDGFIQGILELQTKWLGLRNASPPIAFEVCRTLPGTLRFQFAVPTKRLERKVRTQLSADLPDIGFDSGTNGIPASSEETVGGGMLTTGRDDWHPLRTDFDQPPINGLASLLHRHAMRDTKFLIQVLFQPIAGQPIRNKVWRRQAYQHRNYLKKEKEKIWGSVKPTQREKQQARLVDDKAGNTRFWTSIRFVIIGAKEYTTSRVKELAAGFNRFENPVSGQYLNTVTAKTLLPHRLLHFCRDVANRRFGGWHRRFRTTPQELAGLVSIPSINQNNIQYAQP